MVVSVVLGQDPVRAREAAPAAMARRRPPLPGRSAWRRISIGYSVSTTSTGVFMTFDMWTRMAWPPSRAALAPSPPPWTS